MAIPDFQTVMLPLLKLLSDGQEHLLREAIDSLANEFSLTDEERRALLSSGKQAIFSNRVGWARTYLKKAGLIESTGRGIFKITERGEEALEGNPPKIDIHFLEQYEEFRTFRERTNKERRPEEVLVSENETPREAIEFGYIQIRDELAQELLDQVRRCSPRFFENLVIEVLVSMGYGGSFEDAGQIIGKSGDEGIDGIIKEDRLGLDVVYVQAKRWDGTASVSRPKIQEFVGALEGKRARKGIFITTADFSQPARDYAASVSSQVVLIDGQQLAQLMIDFNVGVTPEAKYEIKKLDSDYFLEE